MAADEPLVIVIGPGLGYALDAIERRGSATRVLAIEPSPVVARGMLARRDLRTWLDSGRLPLLVGPDYAGAGDAWRLVEHADGRMPAIVVPPVMQQLFPAAVSGARALAERIVSGARANEDARRRFAGRYLLNTLENLPSIAALYDAFLADHRSLARLREPDPARAFAAYVPMLTSWRRLPYLDPGIPLSLLPADWPGVRAGAAWPAARADR